jgi:uncharacterized protein (DUF952 family)
MKLFHLLDAAEWEQALEAGRYAPSSLAREGFIHLSTEAQLLGTATKWFAGRDRLCVLELASDRLLAELRYEPVGDQRFPHLYGGLNLDAVVEVGTLSRGADGVFSMPSIWRPLPSPSEDS